MSTQASSAIAAIAAAIACGVGAHGHRVAHVEPVQRGDGVVGPEPRIDPDGERTGGAGAAHPGDELVDEPAGAALGVGLPFAHPGVQHLTGVGPGGEDRVVAEHLGVAEPGAVLVRCRRPRQIVESMSITNGPAPGPAPERPGPLEHPADDGFELADMTEREGAQERAQRRRGHHPMPSTPAVEPARSMSA